MNFHQFKNNQMLSQRYRTLKNSISDCKTESEMVNVILMED